MKEADVLIIGAGPAGAVAAALLVQRGCSVIVLERAVFPRFAIGESLLPQCMDFIDAAGLMDAAKAAGFQPKDGAVVIDGERTTTFGFDDQSAPGWSSTWEVERARFDDILARRAAEAGADVRFGETIADIDVDAERSILRTSDRDGAQHAYRGRFTLDASGAGRVLARHFHLDSPSAEPPRTVLATHIEDNITAADYDRGKILLAMHPQHDDVWYWLIPFCARASIGVAGPREKLASSRPALARLQDWIAEAPRFARLLADAEWDTPVNELSGYASAVHRLHGPGYALLGNAGGFIDPVFSSGIALAMKSALLAADLIARQFNREAVDWNAAFEQPLRRGSAVFKAFIDAWYRGELQPILFAPEPPPSVRRQLCSILAGYVWDDDNPFTLKTPRRLASLAQICQR